MSSFFHPYQPFPKPLKPVPTQNVGTFCFEFDGKWIPYLLGAVSILAIDRTWADDSARATGEAQNLLYTIMHARLCPTPAPDGTESGDEMCCCIRVFEGKIQTFKCGVWTTIEGGDLTQVINGTSQPAQGAPQPAPGECEQFLGDVLYGGRWLLPVPVSAGDEIHVTNALGATSGYINDGLTYRCGDGLLFLAGGCVTGTETFDAGNPMPSAPRDALIAFDGTNYYDCSPAANGLSADFTIPTGITNANLVLLINNDQVGGAGDLSFDIRVCKGAAAPMTLTYALGSGPASAVSGQVLAMTSALNGAHNAQAIVFNTSECCTVTVLTGSGFVPHLGTPWWEYTDCASVNHNGPNPTSGTVPTDFPAATQLQEFEMAGDPGAVFTIQLKIVSIP